MGLVEDALAAAGRLPDYFYVDGKARRAADAIDVVDPGSGHQLTSMPLASVDDVDEAVAVARSSFRAWRGMAPKARGRLLWAIGDAISMERERLGLIEALDTGKPHREALVSVDRTADYFRYYAGMVDKLEGSSIPLGENRVCFTEKVPIGVTGHITPWNVPVSMVARGLAPALACGNTAVVKPAEDTPLSAVSLVEIFERVGLPTGVVNVVTGAGDVVGQHLCEHTDVGHLTFTGSVTTGKRVMTAAATHLASVTLELGGKSPHLVMADADLDAVLPIIIDGAFKNAGQICSAGTRVLVEAGIHDELVERLVISMGRLEIGHGLDNPDMGPLISARQRESVAGFTERARAAGADIVIGGGPAVVEGFEGGFYFEPTLVESLAPDSELAQAEVFGPVLGILPVADLDEAIDLANNTPYGLAAAIQTRDITRAMRYARAVDAGQVFINDYHNAGDTVPFGGMKASGIGREKGLEALDAYCETKAITISI